MSRGRKPVAKPLSAATDCLFWRCTVLTEMLDAIELPPQMKEPIKRMKDALADFEASKPTNGHAPQQMELRP